MQVATKDNFDQVTQGPLAWVDFWAPWCGPCKALAPELAALEKDYGDKVKFVKFNVDGAQEIAERYHVMSIPSLVLFKDGVAKEKVTGVYPQPKLAKYLDQKISEVPSLN